jgi:hypothetical protein
MSKKSNSKFLAELVQNPTARTYGMLSAAGLIATAVLLNLLFDSYYGAFSLVAVGLLGFLFRWSSGPVIFLFLLSYWLLFPFGLPTNWGAQTSQIPKSSIRFADILLVLSALLHLIAQCRYLTAIQIGMPFEAPPPFVKPDAKPTVLPSNGISDSELWLMFARIAIFTILGQVLWVALTEFRLDFRLNFPVTLGSGEVVNSTRRQMPDWANRTLLGIGILAAGGGIVWFVNWYWRLNTLNRDEARLILLDTEWVGMRRDLNRPESWRGRMKRKMNGTLPKKGCGTYLLVIGLPSILVALYLMIVLCAGGFRLYG